MLWSLVFYLVLASIINADAEVQLILNNMHTLHCSYTFLQDSIKAFNNINSSNFELVGVFGNDDEVQNYVSLAEDPKGMSNIQQPSKHYVHILGSLPAEFSICSSVFNRGMPNYYFYNLLTVSS